MTTHKMLSSECIRLQAERVCRAYRTLRGSAHSADFTSAEFPVGLFAELFQQIKSLDIWLQPVEGAELPPREKRRGNEAFAEHVGQRIDSALLCIERARRLTDVCSAAIKALEVENSGRHRLHDG